MTSPRLHRSSAAAALLLLCAAPFVVGVNNEFAGDDLFIVGTRLDPARVESALAFFAEDYWGIIDSGLYRPLGLTALYVQRVLFELAAWPYRLVAIALHGCVVLLLWRLFIPMIGRRAAWCGAALFACHPIHAEPILFVYGQLDLLAALFVITSLWLFSREWRLAATAAALLAMWCKESALIVPVLTWWMFRQQPLTPLKVQRHPAVLTMLAVLVYAGMKLAATGSLVVPPEGTVTGGSIGTVLWMKAVIISAAHAFRLLVVPTGQTIYYGHLRESLMGFPTIELLWCCAAVLVVYLLTRVRDDRTGLMTAFGWTVICWLPVSNVIPTGVLVAERALYLPSAGAAMGVAVLAARWRTPAIVAALAIATATSVFVASSWRTEESLWAKTVDDHPENPRAHAALGLARLRRDAVDTATLQRADESFDRALALNAHVADALYGKGLVRLHRGRPAAAHPFLLSAVKQRPGDAAMVNALRECEASMQRTQAARNN